MSKKGNNTTFRGHKLSIILGIILGIILIYMIVKMNSHPISEGFGSETKNSTKTKLDAKPKSDKTQKRKKQKPQIGQSKLSVMKNGKYNANDELKNYGMDGEEEEAETDLDKHLSDLGAKLGEDTLIKLGNKRSKGKRDNFKNVINEVDNINPGAFDLTSIGGTIRRYNENFNNRLNYAKSKNEGDNLEATMAQGRVIFDEFKKIFLFTDMFA